MKMTFFHTIIVASLLLACASPAFARADSPEPSEPPVEARMTATQIEMAFGSLDFEPTYLSVQENQDIQGTAPHVAVVIGVGAVSGGIGYYFGNDEHTWSGLATATVAGGAVGVLGGARFAGAVFGTASRIAARYGGARGARLSRRLDGWRRSENVQHVFSSTASLLGSFIAGAAVSRVQGGDSITSDVSDVAID